MYQTFDIFSNCPIGSLTGVTACMTNYSMYNSKKLIVCTALKLERQLNSIRVCALCCALGQAAQCSTVAVEQLCQSCSEVCLLVGTNYTLVHIVQPLVARLVCYACFFLLPTTQSVLFSTPTPHYISFQLSHYFSPSFPFYSLFLPKRDLLNNILCVQSNKTKAQKLKTTSSKIHRPPTSFKLLIMPCFCQKLEQQKGLEEKFELLSDLSNVVKNSITSENCAINQCINLLRK